MGQKWTIFILGPSSFLNIELIWYDHYDNIIILLKWYKTSNTVLAGGKIYYEI